jgi:hypothetical protein
MAGTPTFVITNAGLAAAAVATPTGPWISIVGFEIGSAYGYTPEPTDTGLSGSLLYSGTPTSYSNIGDGTINILCEVPPNAGPFQFGEVALMMPGNVMFAKAVFPTAQTKYSALGTNVVSSYELNCLLTLAQGTAIFQITTVVPTTILQVYSWSDIYPPSLSANPTVPLIQVLELSEYGDSTLLSNTSASTWSIDSTYTRYAQENDTPYFQVANASTTWIEVLATDLHVEDLTTVNERFVINTPDGYFRSVLSVVTSGANYRFNLNGTPLPTVPAVGSNITIYRDDMARGTSYYSQILDPLYYDETVLAPDTGTVNAYAATYKQKNPVPYNGMVRSFQALTTNTGASTFACDGGTAYPIWGSLYEGALQGNEIIGGGIVTVKFYTGWNTWVIMNSIAGSVIVPPAQHSNQAINLGQAEGLFAALNGSEYEPFYASILETNQVYGYNGSVLLLQSNDYVAAVNLDNTAYMQMYVAPAVSGQAAVNLSQLDGYLAGYQPYGNYVTSADGHRYALAWTGAEAQIYVDSTYQGNIYTTSWYQPMTLSGLGSYTIWSNAMTRGELVNIPGQPGTWMTMSTNATGSDGIDWLLVRIS